MLLVVNLRGTVNVREPVRTTLREMGIPYRFSATLIPNSKASRGMLNLAKNSVAWCEADNETFELAKGRKERTIRLNSPRGGFRRSIRRQYGQGGILGPNPELLELVRKMSPSPILENKESTS
jgi:large subunit ribosomal protein L30